MFQFSKNISSFSSFCFNFQNKIRLYPSLIIVSNFYYYILWLVYQQYILYYQIYHIDGAANVKLQFLMVIYTIQLISSSSFFIFLDRVILIFFYLYRHKDILWHSCVYIHLAMQCGEKIGFLVSSRTWRKNSSNVISILKGHVIFSLARYYNFFLQKLQVRTCFVCSLGYLKMQKF